MNEIVNKLQVHVLSIVLFYIYTITLHASYNRVHQVNDIGAYDILSLD